MARKKRRSSSTGSTSIVRYTPPPQRPIVINTRGGGGAPSRRRKGGGARVARRGNSAVARVLGGGGGLLPVAETIEGGIGGAFSGIIDDLIPEILVGNKWTRAAIVLGAGTIAARAAGAPQKVVAGLAGGVARKLYDQLTG